MKSIRNILCPTDFSENARNAFEYTLWFADQCGAAIQLLHVVYPQAEPLDFSSIALKSIEKKESLARGLIKKFAAKSLEKMQSFYTFKAEPSIEILVKTGTPTNQISGIAKEIKADLIIMGTKSIHNAFQKIFGSITSATTNHAHCPVLVVPEETKSFKISQLVYTTNLRKIDLFQIWELGKQMRPFSPIFRIVHIAKKAEENTALKMEELESFFEEHPPSLQITYHNFINKNVSKELSEIAHDWEADLLVMYKPHRNFLEEAFHISLTKMATFHFKVPILVIK